MQINEQLLEFIARTPNSFFAVKNAAETLDAHGFVRLKEEDEWTLSPGRYYVTRNSSALIALIVPETYENYQIVACHADSPAFCVKPSPESVSEGETVLGLEKYGGMIPSTWFDRPLSLAGRVMVRTANGAQSRLVNVDRDLLVIPNLAIHMGREEGKCSVQSEMRPLFSSAEPLAALIAREADAAPEDILDTELYLYARDKGARVGENLIVSPRLDDLQCAYASLCALIESRPARTAAVFALLDNEEVGSSTRQGAAGTFLSDVLSRMHRANGRTDDDFLRALARSWMISADNAHAAHPNYPQKADATNRPRMNGGVVIKYNGNRKYTTDAVSGTMVRLICEKAGVPTQNYVNNADLPGGSTLGYISSEQVSVRCADVGLAQLAMHSAVETAGALDAEYLFRAVREYFSSTIRADEDGSISVE